MALKPRTGSVLWSEISVHQSSTLSLLDWYKVIHLWYKYVHTQTYIAKYHLILPVLLALQLWMYQ